MRAVKRKKRHGNFKLWTDSSSSSGRGNSGSPAGRHFEEANKHCWLSAILYFINGETERKRAKNDLFVWFRFWQARSLVLTSAYIFRVVLSLYFIIFRSSTLCIFVQFTIRLVFQWLSYTSWKAHTKYNAASTYIYMYSCYCSPDQMKNELNVSIIFLFDEKKNSIAATATTHTHTHTFTLECI